MSSFEVEVWGSRGSIAACQAGHDRAGCNTTCVSVTIDGTVTILDAGTGLVLLGRTLQPHQTQDLSLFLTHYHYDHLQGLNFFPPLGCSKTNLTVYAGDAHTSDSTEAVLAQLTALPFCPNPLSSHPANVGYGDFVDRQEIALNDGATLTPYLLHHPLGAYGFRIQHRGRVFVFAPDFEIGDPAGDAALAALLQDADLAFLDTMYTVDELKHSRGYGHSNWRTVAQICQTANVRAWRMFHHAPHRTDEQLEVMEAALRTEFPTCGAAREGDRYAL